MEYHKILQSFKKLTIKKNPMRLIFLAACIANPLILAMILSPFYILYFPSLYRFFVMFFFYLVLPTFFMNLLLGFLVMLAEPSTTFEKKAKIILTASYFFWHILLWLVTIYLLLSWPSWK